MIDDDETVSQDVENTQANEPFELPKDDTAQNAEVELEDGFHVFVNGVHNSGPYATAEDAQAFIDSHLGGNGEVRS